MTTFNDMVYQNGGTPVGGMFTNGKAIFVKPSTGSDNYSGLTPRKAVKTLSQALSLATANANDVVYLIAESNTAGSTTDYLSSTLAWNKDGVHLIGINGGGRVAQRSRIAQLSTATGLAPLITWSANNCYVANVHVFHGVADATSIGAVNVTGSRNHFHNCHIAGIGHADMDVADAYSLQLSGGSENLFTDCVIGLDTIARGTGANSEIRMVSGATRNIFEDCYITTYAEAAGHQFLLVTSNGLDRYTIFKDCVFMNMPTGVASGTTMTEAFDITGGGSPDGMILIKGCTLNGATDWEANVESGKVYIDGAAPTNNTSGLAVLIEAT